MANQQFPVQLPSNPQIPSVPRPQPIKGWADIGNAIGVLVRYLQTLVQFLNQLLGRYATDINLLFGASQTIVAASVSLPNTATTLIGNVAFGQLISLDTAHFVSMAVQGVIDASKSFNVIVKGKPSGVQISGLPNATVTSDGSGNFHFSDNGTCPGTMSGDTSLDFYISQSTGGGLTLTSANLGCFVGQSL